MAKKTNVTILIGGIVIIVILLIGYMYFVSNPTIVLSCKEKRFVGFSNSMMPMKAYPEPNACNGFVEVKDDSGKIICSNSDYSKTDQERIKVPCLGLKGKKGEKFHIKFETYSELYGNSSGQADAVYS